MRWPGRKLGGRFSSLVDVGDWQLMTYRVGIFEKSQLESQLFDTSWAIWEFRLGQRGVAYSSWWSIDSRAVIFRLRLGTMTSECSFL